MKVKVHVATLEARARSYPSVGEQLDAIMKLASHLDSVGLDLPASVREWIAKCQEIKRKYPKPDPDNQPA
ncbi:hypothetical protein G6F61_014082 [Rhizopus arrhizus]|jgi:hypothetical protein|nr:hypothetical protein G6F32_017230 [Rhizopus arrhizus]KAG1362882.1 hypothetical protein G6F61_014082 [Rhizopus arrhizus]